MADLTDLYATQLQETGIARASFLPADDAATVNELLGAARAVGASTVSISIAYNRTDRSGSVVVRIDGATPA